MSDPLSITAGVVGLIQASYAITKLLNSFIDAPAEAAIAVTDISEMRVILEQIQNFNLRFEAADKARTGLIQVDRLVDVISGCVVTFSEFEDALDKITRSSKTLVGRAKWAMWDQEKIDDLVARLQRHKLSLSVLVTILTGYHFLAAFQVNSIADSISDTQLATWDSMERLNVAAERFNIGALERSLLPDNESVTSQKIASDQIDMISDTRSIVTVLHNPQDQDSIPGMPCRFEFELDLRRTRPYQAMNLEATTSTISLLEPKKRGWSILSGYSLADVSNISVISLYICLSDLYNPQHYELSNESFMPIPSISAEYLVRATVKGLRLKSTFKSVKKNVQANLHKRTLATMYDRGREYYRQKNMVEAETTWRRTLDDCEKFLGWEDKLTLNVAYKLAVMYSTQGKLVDAEAMLQRTLEGIEKTLGLQHESTLAILHDIGSLYFNQGKLVDAEAMLQRALAGREKTLGLKHTATLSTVHNLGRCYEAEHKLAEAEILLQRALAGRDKVLGLEHESTLDTAIVLGVVYYRQERYAEAELMYRRALDSCEEVLGPAHALTLEPVFRLGNVYDKQEKLVDAEAMYRRALDGYDKVLGPTHDSTLYLALRLGEVYDKQEKLADAEAMFQRALEGYEKLLGADHQITLKSFSKLKDVYNKQVRYAKAHVSTGSRPLQESSEIVA